MLEALAALGVGTVALRCAGYNNVDLDAAARLGITVVRVPAYSPNAVAEHTLALILCLNRHIPRAYMRVRDGNFALDGLLGFDLEGKTAGVVGTGQIGRIVARLLWHFALPRAGPRPVPRRRPGRARDRVRRAGRRCCARADVVSLNCPLTPETHHLVNAAHDRR